MSDFKALSLKVYTMPEAMSHLEWALWNSRASLPEKLLHDSTAEYYALQARIEKLESIASTMNVALKLYVKNPPGNLLKILQEYKSLKGDK